MAKEAQARDRAAAHQSVDKAADGTDLLAEQPYGHHDLASNGEGDGYHAGPVGSPFSQVRGRPGGPPPVRDAREADRGTRMVERGLDLTDPITQSANGRGLETVDTLGNPKPREDSDPSVSTPSGFKLPEARAWGEKYAAVASCNSCIHGLPY